MVCIAYISIAKQSSLEQSRRGHRRNNEQPTRTFAILLFAVSALLHFAAAGFSLFVEGVRTSNGFGVEVSEIAKLAFQLLAALCALFPVFRSTSRQRALDSSLFAVVAGGIAGTSASWLVNPETSAFALTGCVLLPTLTAIGLSVLSIREIAMNPVRVKDDSRLETSQPSTQLDRIPAATSLSGREKEVLELTLEGRTSNEIGNLLRLAVPTVSTYRTRGYKKLQVSSKQELLQVITDNADQGPESRSPSSATAIDTAANHRARLFDSKLLVMMVSLMITFPLLPSSLARAGSIATALALLAYGTVALQECGRAGIAGNVEHSEVELLGARSLICGCAIALSHRFLVSHTLLDANSIKLILLLICSGMAYMGIYLWLREVKRIIGSTNMHMRELPATHGQIRELFKGMGFDSVEQDVLADSLAGASASAIATSRHISLSTVHAKKQHAYDRLDVHGRAELAGLVSKLLGRKTNL